jgi:shikimate dehydrogenase
VSHSLGPRVHNRGFAAAGIDAVYIPMPVAPGWESFKATIGECIDHRRLDFGGCSVTLPHKEHLLRFGREVGAEIDPLASRIGAANTLVVDRDGEGAVTGLKVLNTDAPAAVDALARGFDPARPNGEVLRGKRVAVIGAGGVSRAVAAGLLAHDAEVVVFNRTRTRSENVVRDLRDHGAISVGRTMDELACGCFHAFVNATPVGMAGGPAPDESVLPDEIPFDDSIVVMDTVYTPRNTPMLAIAADRGARVVDGSAMFVSQAEAQFRAWTGTAPAAGLYASLLPG